MYLLSHSQVPISVMVRMSLTTIEILAFLIFLYCLIPESCSENPSSTQNNEESSNQSENPVTPQHRPSEEKRRSLPGSTYQTRRRSVKGARTLKGSVYEGLRSDYLLSVTLPCTLGMLAFIILLLVCMRTDGWLYHLFTDDYVPPAVKKRMDEEARRAEGKKARMEREDNWNEIRRNLNAEMNEVTERVKATIPSNL